MSVDSSKSPALITKRGGVYEIRNKINGRRYIGSSHNLKERFRQHKWSLECGNHRNCHLQSAWNKYGKENFEFKVLAVLELCEIIPTEQRLLDNIFSEETPYNIAICATNGQRGRKHSDKTKKLLSELKTGLKQSPETCAKKAAASKGNNYALGTIRSKEAIFRSSIHNMKVKHPQDVLDRILLELSTDDTLTIKTCRTCGLTRDITQYDVCSKSKDKHRSDCKECRAKYYIDNADAIKSRAYKYQEDNKNIVREHHKKSREKRRAAKKEYDKKYRLRIKEKKAINDTNHNYK